MANDYVHGYDPSETKRLHDQAATLKEILHADTLYPAGSRVLEAGCGVGAQTVILASQSFQALFTSIDPSEESLAEARKAVQAAALGQRMGAPGDWLPSRIAGQGRRKCLHWTDAVPLPARSRV